MSTEAQELIKEYRQKAKDSSNSYEKAIWVEKIHKLEEGICPLCHSELPLNHPLTSKS